MLTLNTPSQDNTLLTLDRRGYAHFKPEIEKWTYKIWYEVSDTVESREKIYKTTQNQLNIFFHLNHSTSPSSSATMMNKNRAPHNNENQPLLFKICEHIYQGHEYEYMYFSDIGCDTILQKIE